MSGVECSERPKGNDPRVREVAIAALAVECAAWGDGTSAATWERVLARSHLNSNGYEIARDLERYEGVCGIDMELVEILDGASSLLWDAHRDLVKQWVAEAQPQPQFGVGDRIQSRNGTGRVSGFVSDQACYLMVPDGEELRFAGGGGVYVPYEIAEAEQPQVGAA